VDGHTSVLAGDNVLAATGLSTTVETLCDLARLLEPLHEDTVSRSALRAAVTGLGDGSDIGDKWLGHVFSNPFW
jgi:hypothetical protein